MDPLRDRNRGAGRNHVDALDALDRRAEEVKNTTPEFVPELAETRVKKSYFSRNNLFLLLSGFACITLVFLLAGYNIHKFSLLAKNSDIFNLNLKTFIIMSVTALALVAVLVAQFFPGKMSRAWMTLAGGTVFLVLAFMPVIIAIFDSESPATIKIGKIAPTLSESKDLQQVVNMLFGILFIPSVIMLLIFENASRFVPRRTKFLKITGIITSSIVMLAAGYFAIASAIRAQYLIDNFDNTKFEMAMNGFDFRHVPIIGASVFAIIMTPVAICGLLALINNILPRRRTKLSAISTIGIQLGLLSAGIPMYIWLVRSNIVTMFIIAITFELLIQTFFFTHCATQFFVIFSRQRIRKLKLLRKRKRVVKNAAASRPAQINKPDPADFLQ